MSISPVTSGYRLYNRTKFLTDKIEHRNHGININNNERSEVVVCFIHCERSETMKRNIITQYF